MNFVEVSGYVVIFSFVSFYFIYLRKFVDDSVNVVWAYYSSYEGATILVMAIVVTLAINHIEK